MTDTDSTFIEWSTEYSNDVDAEFIADARWKKRDMFAAMKQTLAPEEESKEGEENSEAPEVAPTYETEKRYATVN